MSTPSVNKILVALKAIVDRNVSFHCWQDFSGSKNYGYGVKKVADPPEMEILNVANPHVRGNKTHCVADQQIMEM